MTNFRVVADHLQKMASVPRPPAARSDTDVAMLETAAKTLNKLEQMKQYLLTADSQDEESSDRLAEDLMALLGIQPGS